MTNELVGHGAACASLFRSVRRRRGGEGFPMFNVSDAHAEALANLAEIWAELQKPDRSLEARKKLEKLYKNSPWAKNKK